MNNSWPLMKLGDLCQTGSGGTPLKSQKEYYENGTIPWLLSGEVSQGEVRCATKFITQTGMEQSAAKLFPTNTVLVAMYGATAGQVGILRFEATTNQAICGIFPSEHFLPDFLFYVLLSRKDELIAQAAGNAQPNISQIKIRNTRVPVPTLPEQKRIARILDEAFDAIASAKANAEKNLQNARFLFESHLESVFSKRDAYPTVLIRDVADVFDGPHATPKTVEVGPIFLGISALQDGTINLGETRHVTPEDFKKWTRRVKPQQNDIVFSYETRLGQAAIIPEGLDCCLGRRMGLVRLDQKRVHPMFFVYQYISGPFRHYLKSRTVRGATVDRIALKEFPSFPVALPTVVEQQRITAHLDELRKQTQHLQSVYNQKLAALSDLKKSLLHQAIIGAL